MQNRLYRHASASIILVQKVMIGIFLSVLITPLIAVNTMAASSKYTVNDAIIEIDSTDSSIAPLYLVFDNKTPFPVAISSAKSDFFDRAQIIFPKNYIHTLGAIHVPANTTLFMKKDTPHILLKGLSLVESIEKKERDLYLIINNEEKLLVKAKIVNSVQETR